MVPGCTPRNHIFLGTLFSDIVSACLEKEAQVCYTLPMSETGETLRLLVVIPTYNEIENIRAIIPAVMAVIPQDAAVLVSDDASPDGTGAAVKELMKDFPDRLYLKEGQGKQGLATAYI